MLFNRQLSPDAAAPGTCLHCKHFCNDPAAIERSFPGLIVMGSARASVRAYDGLCDRHGVYLACTDRCGDFEEARVHAPIDQRHAAPE
jgi:hypothetical protein